MPRLTSTALLAAACLLALIPAMSFLTTTRLAAAAARGAAGFVSTATRATAAAARGPLMREASRAQHLQRVASFGLLGGVAMFASGGSARAEGDGFEVSASGLKSKILKEGTGAIPAPSQTVNVHYTGWLDDFESPKKFDSSYDRGKPLSFRAGVGQVIQGWDEAVLQMKIGEKRRVIIPANLGYGARGVGPIPPNSQLYFEMELKGISP